MIFNGTGAGALMQIMKEELAGCGLGEEATTLKTKAELDAVRGNGFFLYNGEAILDHPSAQYNGRCEGGVLSIKHGSNCTQFFILSYPNKGSMLKRDSWNDVSGWEEFCWLIAPMTPGVEYRTAELHNGKSVYAMDVDIGALPNATTKKITTTINSALVGLVDLRGILKTGGNHQYDFSVGGAGVVLGYTGSHPQIEVSTTADMSAQTGVVYLKYTY